MKVYALSLAFAVLLTAGLFLLLRVSFADYFSRWEQLLMRRKSSVRHRRKELVAGQTRAPLVLRYFHRASEILTQTGRTQLFPLVIVLTAVLGVAGVFAGILADNPFLVPVLGIGFAAAPVVFVHSREAALARSMNARLKETVNVITNTYIQSEDVVQSFKSNLSLLKPPFAGACAEFVAEATFLQANIPKALQNLRGKIDNDQFHEWCDVLIQCYDNKELKYVLPVIVDKIDETIRVQTELDTLTIPETARFRTILIIGAATILLLALIEPAWWFDLVGSSFGKLAVALAAAITVGSVIAAVRILRPVKY